MKKFEYYQHKDYARFDIDYSPVLKKLGKDGWELVSIIKMENMMICFFKRELIQDSERNLESEKIVNDWIDKNLKK